jgi:hypothetical protein
VKGERLGGKSKGWDGKDGDLTGREGWEGIMECRPMDGDIVKPLHVERGVKGKL